jgi:hypothetical protein
MSLRRTEHALDDDALVMVRKTSAAPREFSAIREAEAGAACAGGIN